MIRQVFQVSEILQFTHIYIIWYKYMYFYRASFIVCPKVNLSSQITSSSNRGGLATGTFHLFNSCNEFGLYSILYTVYMVNMV